VTGLGKSAIAGIDERDNIFTQISVVAARSERVDKLRSPVGRPSIDVYHYARGSFAASEDGVSRLGKGQAEGTAVRPHGEVAGVTLKDVDRRIAPIWIAIVVRGYVYPQWTVGRIAKPIADQGGTVDDVVIEATC
jgi:hypothetical protein